MRRYETIYILRPNLNEEEINTIVESTNTILGSDGGQTISLDQWGLRKLAYLINKETQGYYIYCDYATEPVNVAEMERKFRIDDSVMKYMTVKLADAITKEGIEAARGEHEAAKAAAEAAEAEAAAEENKVEDKTPKTTTVEQDSKETKAEAAAEENKVEDKTPETTTVEQDSKETKADSDQ